MTLYVDGPDLFKEDVEKALEQICPCRDYVLASDGALGITTAPLQCFCYCRHRSGCDLIADLRTEPALKFTIDISYGDSQYDLNNDIVYWAPDDTGPPVDSTGGNVPPSALLAHELVHAWLDLKGKNIWDENLAVRGENEIRYEMCVPLRTTYSGDKVPSYSQPVLEARDEGCDCAAETKNVLALINATYCRVYVAAIAVKWAVHRFMHPPAHVPSSIPSTPFRAYARSGKPDYIGEQFRRAWRVRENAPHRALVDDLQESWRDDGTAFLLEWVGTAGRYRVAWVAEDGNGLQLVTNMRLDDTLPAPFARGPDSLVRYGITDATTVSDVRSRIARMQFDDGQGANAGRVDGSVQYLWTTAPGASRHTALYGYSYPAIHGSWWRPTGQDGPRWDAIVAAYEIWRDLVRAAAGPPTIIARGVR